MANFAKYTAGATGHLMAHFERRKDEKGQYVRFGNQSIDLGRTPENYNLAPDRPEGQLAFLQKRLSEVKVQKRADVNVMGSWIVTLPRLDYTPDQERDFFQACYQFLAEKYGEQNVISAYVHRDETQPHMHFAFIPVVPDKKWNAKHPDSPRYKVSAKECVTKQELDQFHPQLQTYLDKTFDYPDLFPILNGATAGGNRTMAEMKAELAAAVLEEEAQNHTQELNDLLGELAEVDQELFETKLALESAQEKIQKKQNTLVGLQEDILEAKETLQNAQEAIQTKNDTLIELEGLQGRLNAQNAVLRAEKKDLEQAIGGMTARIEEGREVLRDLDSAIKRKNAEGERAFGLAGWQAAIQREREEKMKNTLRDKLARFAEYLITHVPRIRMLWETFEKNPKEKQRPIDKQFGE